MRADTRGAFTSPLPLNPSFLEDISHFSGATDTRFGLLGMSVLGFKTRMHPLICIRYRLHAMNSSDSPLV